MTDDQTIKLSRIFNRCLLDLESVGNFDFLSGDREQAMQVLMDTMESAMSVKENSMQSLDVEIGRLEDRVVETAVKIIEVADAPTLQSHTTVPDSLYQDLWATARALITARKKAEQQNFPLSC